MFNFACNCKVHLPHPTPPHPPIECDGGYTASEIHRTPVVEVEM